MRTVFSRVPSAKSDLLVCPVFEDKDSLKSFDPKLKALLKGLDFKGKDSEKELLIYNSKNFPKRILFVGLGKKSKVNSEKLRNALANSMKQYMSDKVDKVALLISSDLADHTQVLVEGIGLVNYSPAKYKTGKQAKKIEKKLYKELHIVHKTLPKKLKDAAKRASLIIEAVNTTRDLVNGPSNIVSVEEFGNQAKKIAKENNYKIAIHEKAWLKKKGMGAFLSVNQGSGAKEAKLVVLEYNPLKATKKDPILLVGKGVIFDSGGYNLKPSRHIEDMHQDKAGGSLVLGVFKLLKGLGIKRRVIGIIPVTENLIDAHSQKPADVVKAYSGKTIEIRNTDAEGRMILADGLAYGIEKYKPEYTIDFATLTGACMVALGDRYAGLFGNDKALKDKLTKAGDTTGELIWELPLHDDFRENMKGRIADLRNIDNGTSHLAGASKAAVFLEFFVGKAKWAHLDIAGMAYNEKPKAQDQPLATGYGVRLIVNFLENI